MAKASEMETLINKLLKAFMEEPYCITKTELENILEKSDAFITAFENRKLDNQGIQKVLRRLEGAAKSLKIIKDPRFVSFQEKLGNMKRFTTADFL